MTNIVVLMAGDGTRFQGFDAPKPFVEYNDVPLFHFATESFDRMSDDNKFIFILQDKHLDKYPLEPFLRSNYKNYEIVIQNGRRNGPGFSVKECFDLVDKDDDIFIVDCDQYNIISLEEMGQRVSKIEADGAIVVAQSDDPAHCYIKYNSDFMILDIQEKNRVYSHASSGIYYWKKTGVFIKYCNLAISSHDSSKELYISDIFKLAKEFDLKFIALRSKRSIIIGDTKQYYDFICKFYFGANNLSLGLMYDWDTKYDCDSVEVLDINWNKFFSIKGLSIKSRPDSEEKRFYGKTYIYTYDVAFFHAFYDKLAQYHYLKNILPDLNIVFVTPDNMSISNLFKDTCDHNHLKSIPITCTEKEIGEFTTSAEEYIHALSLINNSMDFMKDIHKEYDSEMQVYGIPNHNLWFEEVVFVHDREGIICPIMLSKHFPTAVSKELSKRYHKNVYSYYMDFKKRWSKKLHKEEVKKKIFISRKSNNMMIDAAKKLKYPTPRETDKHENILIPILEKHGFEVYDFEGMSFLDQIQVIKNADTFVAISGSGIHNSFFMDPGSKVVEIYTQNWSTPYQGMLLEFPGIDYFRINMFNMDLDDESTAKEIEKAILKIIS